MTANVPAIPTMPEHFTQMQATVIDVVQQANALKIVDAPSCTMAANILMTVKGALKQIEAQRLEITRPANEIIRKRNAEAKDAAKPFLDAETKLKRDILEYQEEQRRIAAEAQRKLDDAARREREKLAAQAAAAARKAAEKAAAERAAAEQAAAAGRHEEAERLATRAESTEAKAAGKISELAERSASVSAPTVETEAPAISGVAAVKRWTFEIVDPAKVNPAFLMPDTVKIRRQVVTLGKGAQDLVGPGVRIFEERGLSSRSA